MSNQLTNAISVSNGKVTTTSRKIAEIFGKEHFHVLRDIEALEIPDDFRKSNFGVSEYQAKNGLGKTINYKMYLITRDGFTLLAMGFTGAKAMQFKIAYIEAFNAMEAKLREQQAVPVQPELPLETSEPSALLRMKFNRVPVIPTPDLAKAFGMDHWTLLQFFFRNREKFTDNVDMFRVKGVTNALMNTIHASGSIIKTRCSSVTLWTESGVRKMQMLLDQSFYKHKQLTCSVPIPAKAPSVPAIPGLVLRKPDMTAEKVYHFRLENLLNLEGLPKIRELLDALSRAGYDVSDQRAELAFIENVGYRMAKWHSQLEQYLSSTLDSFRIFGNARYVSRIRFRNGEFSSSESRFDNDVPKMEVPV